MARQMLKAAPLAMVCFNKSVQIHSHTVLAAIIGRSSRPDTLNPVMRTAEGSRVMNGSTA
jgi:hypothetical protein